MAFIAQRTRRRVRRSQAGFAGAALSGTGTLRAAVFGAMPPLNRQLRRRLGSHRAQLAVALTVSGLTLVAFAAHSAISVQQGVRPATTTIASEALDAALSATTATLSRAPVLPGFPGGIPASITVARSVPQFSAVLAGDLWQLNNFVYQWKTLAPLQTPTSALPAGPTISDLLQAQARLTIAQLTLMATQQRATDDQLGTARAAIAQAQAAVQTARQNAAVVSTAALTTANSNNAQAITAAQIAVTSARAALDRVQRPYSDQQIAQAQAELQSKQQALAQAKATLAAPPATAVAVQPAPVAAGRLERQFDVPPSVLAGAIPSDVGAKSSAPLALPTAQGTNSAASENGAAGAAPSVGAQQGAVSTGQAPSAGAGAGAPAAVNAGVAAATLPSISQPAGPAQAAAVAAPAAVTAPTASNPNASTAPAASPVSAATVALLEQQVTDSQRKVAQYTAAADPATIKPAADALTAAQQHLAALQAQPAAIAPTPQPSTTTSGAATTAADDASPQVQQANQQYQQAVQALQMLSTPTDPAALDAAQAEVQAAQQNYNQLLAQADEATRSQAAATLPDPRSLLNYTATVGALSVNPNGFTWPANGPLTQMFGVPELGTGSPHTGIDIGQGLGLPVRAAATGVVSFSGGDPCCDYGYYVDIMHPNGYMSRYGHLLVPSPLKPGDHVVQGQVIGLSGSTGFSTGPHVHFEIRLNGVPVNPFSLLGGILPQPLR